MSQYRYQGSALQLKLDTMISQHDFVYRATTQKMVEVYREKGIINGHTSGTYMTTEYVGLDPQILKDKGQYSDIWGNRGSSKNTNISD